jgi:hypothetical protein
VTKVGAQPEECVVDRLSFLSPSLQPPHGKGVTQVVDAWDWVVAAGLPAQTRLHAPEHVLHRSLGKSGARLRHEERRFSIGGVPTVAGFAVPIQLLDDAAVHRQAS